MHTSQKIVFIVATSILLSTTSCGRDRSIILLPENLPSVDRNGEIEGIPVMEGKKVVQFLYAGLLVDIMKMAPGKIDRIIQDNPDWQFFFYIYCKSEKETEILCDYLDQFDCRFPVMIDYDQMFLKKNRMDHYTAIGFILDRYNKTIGMSVIGDPRSFFDSEFNKAKRIVK